MTGQGWFFILMFLVFQAVVSLLSYRAGYWAGYRSRFPDLDEEVDK